MVAHIGALVIVLAGRFVGDAHGALRDLDLGKRRASGKLLDCGPIEIAGRKIHLAVDALGGEDIVYRAHALEQGQPVDFRDQPHADDDVADGDGGSDLSLLLVGDSQIGGRSAFRQPVVEPCQSRRDTWILVAQHVDELHGERIRDGPGRGVRQHFRGSLRRFAAHPEKSPRQLVRLQSRDLALFDPDGDTTQVLNQDDAQG